MTERDKIAAAPTPPDGEGPEQSPLAATVSPSPSASGRSQPSPEGRSLDARAALEKIASMFTVRRTGVAGLNGSICVGEIYEIAEAALSKPEKNGWKPIETAPKDGTEVLICWADGIRNYHVESARWSDHKKTWQGTYTFFTTHAALQPTHWRPLPAPPAREGKG